MTSILRSNVLSQFSCLGEKCEDTCCQGWSMQVDEQTIARYQKEAPMLMAAVENSAESPWIMRKNPDGFCIKFDNGLCGIHKQYGDRFLGDACHFYPRVTRKLGEQTIMTASMSCPEIARLALFEENISGFEKIEIERLPSTLKNYLPDDIAQDEALAMHEAFLQAAQDTQASAERCFLRIASVSRSLERLDKKSWPQAAPFYFKNADARIVQPEKNISDPFNLLHALCGLIVASQKKPSVRLRQTISDMEQALSVKLDWENVRIDTNEASLPAYEKLQVLWQEKYAALYAPILRRWLAMQLSLALYPYAGLGNTIHERITIIGVRLATIKLALMCSCGMYEADLKQDMVVRVVQSLSRFLDHLGDPAFSLQIYAETGWTGEARMHGLLVV